MKTLSKNLLAAAVMVAASSVVSIAQADDHGSKFDVSASVGASNFYLWRGQDLGNGSAQVWGDLSATYGGLYGGVWAASGDDKNGNEYDLYVGYGGEVGGFSYDLSVWNYNYPDVIDGVAATGFADASEAIATVGYGMFSYTHIRAIAGASGTTYQSYDLSLSDFTFTYGDHKDKKTEDHFNVAYAYNDNLSITAVFPLGDEVTGSIGSGDPLINFGLSLPIE